MNNHIQNIQPSAAGVPMITFETEYHKYRPASHICIVSEFLVKDPGEALEIAQKEISEFLDIDPDERPRKYISISQDIDERGHLFYFELKDVKDREYNGERE